MGLLGTCGVPASSCCRHVDISTAVHRAGVPSTSGPLPAHGPSPAPVDAGRARRVLAGRFPEVVRHPRRSAAVSTTSRHCRRRPGDDASSEQAVTRCTPVRPQTVHILGDNSSTSRPGTGRSPLRTASPARSAGREQGCPQLWRSRPGWERRVTSSRPAGSGRLRGTCGHRGRQNGDFPEVARRLPGGTPGRSPHQLLGTRALTPPLEPDFPAVGALAPDARWGQLRGTCGHRGAQNRDFPEVASRASGGRRRDRRANCWALGP
jgi:hypothetical protein